MEGSEDLKNKMSYAKRLIGNINLEAENLQIEIGKSHFSDLESLADDYGWVGKGFKVILNKPTIKDSLRHGGVSDLLIGNGNVQGLEVFDEPDRNVLSHLLTKQYQRSLPIFDAVKKGELEQYDDVSIGVVKGVVLGGVIGLGLDFIGVKGTLPEMLARMGPATLESSAISHEVERGKDRAPKTGLEKIVVAIKELPQDTVNIVKRMPGGFYQGINLYGWIDRLRGRTQEYNHSTTTELWSAAQESGPYRGLIGLSALKTAEPHLKSIFEGSSRSVTSSYHALHYVLESLLVFWVNTGNNVQGGWAVYKNFKKELQSKRAAIKKTVSDPFQLANIIVCSTWYGTELYLRSKGMAPEQFGNIGAALESAALSCDTAVAGQVAKPLAYAFLIIPAKYSVTDRNLRKLANQYGSNYFVRPSK